MILEDLRNCLEISAQNWLALFLPLTLSSFLATLFLSPFLFLYYILPLSVFSPFACFHCTQEIAAYFLAHLKSQWQCRGGDGGGFNILWRNWFQNGILNCAQLRRIAYPISLLPATQSCSNFSDLFNIVTPFFACQCRGVWQVVGFRFSIQRFSTWRFLFWISIQRGRASKVRQTEGRAGWGPSQGSWHNSALNKSQVALSQVPFAVASKGVECGYVCGCGWGRSVVQE